jgi:pimeloyl-ACP methyl ester carboxylesterase
MGGMIAQELVLAYPGKVNRLILSASSSRVPAKSSFIAWSNIEVINRGELQTSVNWQLSFCFSKALFANDALLSEIKESALNASYPVTLDGLISQFAAVASLRLILFAISRVMISQRRRCFSFKVIVPMLLACGHFH